MDGKEDETTQRMQELIVKSCEYKYEPGCVALKVREDGERGERGWGRMEEDDYMTSLAGISEIDEIEFSSWRGFCGLPLWGTEDRLRVRE
eukprot:19820-Hanusia_phi.AAC.2